VISSVTDVVDTDKDGDLGILLKDGPMVLRLRRALALPGGGTVNLWVGLAAYATGAIDCYFVGTENNTALAAQAWTVTQTNTGAVSATGGNIRMNAPAVGSGNSVAQLNAPTITGAKKWWMTCNIRGPVATNSSAALGLFQLTTGAEVATQFALAQGAGIGTTAQQLHWTTTWVNASTTHTIRGSSTGSAFPLSTPWMMTVDSGAAISDLVTVRVDGATYSTFRRNSDSATTSTSYTLTPLAVGGPGVAAQLEMNTFYRLVWD
jgi:hypothetical protein